MMSERSSTEDNSKTQPPLPAAASPGGNAPVKAFPGDVQIGWWLRWKLFIGHRFGAW